MFESLVKVFVTVLLYTVEKVVSKRYFVDVNSNAMNPTGNSWNSAYSSIQDALDDITGSGSNELWIAEGHYYPDSSIPQTSCYGLTSAVTFYGGFDGTESNINDRPTPLGETILDGDIGTIGDITDNCYHIISFDDPNARDSTFDGIIFQNGYAMSDGDGSDDNVYAGVLNLGTESTLNAVFKDCTFRNNYARHGGVFFLADGNTIEINGCTFENNHAIEGSYLGGYGGCIAGTFAVTANITNSNFYNNSATYKGGALYGDYGATYDITGSTFEDNSVPGGHGGAIFFEDRNSQTDGTYLTIKDSIFEDNSAYQYGGAICVFNGIFVTIENTQFLRNTAVLGGAIVNYDDIVYEAFNSNTFTDNLASEDPIYNDMYNDSLLTTTQLTDDYPSIETGNISYYLTLIENNKGVTSEYNTNVEQSSTICYVDADNENNCQGPSCNGGGMGGGSSSNNDGTSWSSAYTDLQDCLDDISGTGEIWVKAGTYKPTESLLWATANSPAYYGFTIQEGTSMYGGFAGTESSRSERNIKNNPTYLSCSQVDNGLDCSIILDAAKDCIVDGFIFTGSAISSGSELAREGRRLLNDGGVYTTTINTVLTTTSGGRGGGVFSNGTNIVIVNSVFYDMVATKGGGVYCIGYDTASSFSAPTIINAVFAGNTAERGAAIAGDVGCDFTCKYCWMLDNRVTEKGGAIYLDYFCSPTFEEVVFKGNQAYESGGCIAADGGSAVSVTIGQFEKNTGEWEAGCLYGGSKSAEASQGFTIANSYFYNNNAPYGNDDVWLWWGNTITLDNVPTSAPTEPTPAPTGMPIEPTLEPTSVPTGVPIEPTSTPSDAPGSSTSGSISKTITNYVFYICLICLLMLL